MKTYKFLNHSIKLIFQSYILLVPVILLQFLSPDKSYLHEKNNYLCGIYCKMAVNYQDYLINQDFDKYYLGKSLPSFFAHYISKVLNIELIPKNLNLILEVTSYSLLMIMVPILILTCKELKLGDFAYWMAFTVVVINVINFKYVPNSQELPDTWAIFYVVVACYLFIKRKFTLFLLLAFTSAYVQSQVKIGLYIAIVFFFAHDVEFIRIKRKKVQIAVISLIAAFFAIILILFNYLLKDLVWVMYYSPYTITYLLPISILLATVFLYYILEIFIHTNFISNLLKNFSCFISIKGVISILIFELFHFGFTRLFANGEVIAIASTFTGAGFIGLNLFWGTIQQPGKFFIPHVIAFGPIFVLFFLSLFQFRKNDRFQMNPGIILISIYSLLLSIDSESRHLAGVLPFLVLVTLSSMVFNNSIRFLLLLINIGFSRFFADYSLVESNRDPWLLLMGPWWKPNNFLMPTIVTGVVCAFTYILIRNKQLIFRKWVSGGASDVNCAKRHSYSSF